MNIEINKIEDIDGKEVWEWSAFLGNGNKIVVIQYGEPTMEEIALAMGGDREGALSQ